MITVEQDQANRDRIRNSLGESLLVEAAAGTGKTTQLVARVVSVFRQGLTTPDRVVAVTFTRKAAGELKLRLRQQLEEERRKTDAIEERANLERAISRLEESRIGTIHSFCAELLRERPVEAGVDPDFVELSEDDAPRLFDQVYQVWIQRKLGEMPEVLKRTLSRLATWTSFGSVSPLTRIRDAAWRVAEWRDFVHPWRTAPFERKAAVERLVEHVDLVARASRQCDYKHDYLRRSLEPARAFSRRLAKAQQLHISDLAELEAGLIQLHRDLKRDRRKGRGKFAPNISRQQMLDSREALLDELERFQIEANADLAAQLRREFTDLLADYEDLKRRRGALDFVDLLLRVRNLLRDNQGVRGYLQTRFSHVFVDEFQDTDPLQAEILILLCSQRAEQDDWRKVELTRGKLFVVGDPKQSIYRFRRADVLLYQEVKQVLRDSGARLVYLSRNFRSVRPLQLAVNAAFEAEMQLDPVSGQPDYVPLLEHLPPIPGQPALVALPVPEPYGYTQVSRMQVEAGQPAVVGGFLNWLLRESGWKVRSPEDPSELVEVMPHHVCIIFRRFLSWNRDVTRPYVESLEALDLPHLLVGSRTFHLREEVETLRAALTAIEWPDDEVSVYATLKGSLFAVSDSALFRFREEIGRLHPFQRLPSDPDEELSPVAEALRQLAELHRERNRRPIVQTVQELLEYTRAHAGFALRPAGEQVLANVQKVCEMARQYELGGGISFRGFVDLLIEEAEKPRSGEAPVIEEGAEGVRLMTLHSAKGLEFPVVVLADITANLSSREPDKYVDLQRELCAMKILGCSPWELIDHHEEELQRDRAEGVRIAYVAATRARDLLVAPTVGEGPLEGWAAPMNAALYPPKTEWRKAEAAPGCPPFGPASVLERPSRYDGLKESSVQPGNHRPERGEHRVVWWDPALLRPGEGRDFRLRHDRLLQRDEGGEQSRRGFERYREWKERRSELLEQGQEPEYRLLAAADAPQLPEGTSPQVQVDFLERAAGRPSGREFGVLVHTILRDIDLAAERSEIERLTRYWGRVSQSSEAQVDAAVEAVDRTLRHPLLLRARQASNCFRELPFILPLEDGRTVEGVIDLAFREDSGWIVVDFKTDADLDPARDRYLRQIGWYVYALSELEQAPAEGWLLGI